MKAVICECVTNSHELRWYREHFRPLGENAFYYINGGKKIEK